MSPISHPLEFERPIAELEGQLERLKDEIAGGNTTKREEFAKLETRLARLKSDIYGKLTPYQRVQLSRHFDRPFTLDFIKYMVTDFI